MDTQALIDELVRDEALKLRIYYDSKGIPTIGIGRNLNKGLTKAEAYFLCHNDIDGAVADLDHAFPWWRELSDIRQRVLVNMCFNMGIARLTGFHKMFGHLQAGEYELAAAEMLNSDWSKEVGDRSTRLAQMMQLDQPQ